MPLPSAICVNGLPMFDRFSSIFCALRDISNSCETPELVSAEINGDVLTLVFSTEVTGGSGFTGMVAATPAVFIYVSGSGTNTLVLDSDTAAESGDTVTLDYTPGDVANEDCPLAEFSDFAVTNNTGAEFFFLRPGGVDTYFRPGGVDTYLRP